MKWKHIVFLDAAADFSNPNNNILNSLNEHYVLDKKLEFYEIFKVYEYKQNK